MPAGLTWIGLTLVSYLLGGIPTAYLATRFLKGRDIRQMGDRNVGAANVYRNVGPRVGIAVGMVDIAKGSAAILLVRALQDSVGLEMLAGVAVLAGHNWPAHLRFRGGRGAATAVGLFLALEPTLAIPLGLTAVLLLDLTKKSTVALGFFLISVPILAWPLGYSPAVAAYALGVGLLVGLSHYFSVRRLTSLEQRTAGEPVSPPGIGVT